MISRTPLSARPLPDSEISRRVRYQLLQTRQPAIQHVQVDTANGAVTLTGNLPSFYLKQVVQTVAASVDGVRQLHNQVQVVRVA